MEVTLESLRGKLNLKEFVEGISVKCLEIMFDSREFDSKPFIRTFEATVDQLLKVKRKVSRKIDDLEDQTAASESSTKLKILDIANTFRATRQGFQNLETQVSQVATTAVKIGEQLENIDNQRSRAVEARDLIRYFLEFNKSATSHRLDALRANGDDGEYKAVVIAKRLSSIAKEVDVAGTEQARANIEKYCEEIEKSILESFNNALVNGDRSKMRQCARTLFDFNGGNSCFQSYINQNEFFINSSVQGFIHDFTFVEMYTTTAIPPADPQILGFYNDIRKTIEREWETVAIVFPNSTHVMQQFVQRIFAQSVQGHLESLLLQAEKRGPSVYLKVLASIHAATEHLFSDISKFDENVIAASGNSNSQPALTALLERSFEDLFVPYTEGDRYFNTEYRLYKENHDALILPFQTFIATRARSCHKRGFKTLVMAPLHVLPSVLVEKTLGQVFAGVIAGAGSDIDSGLVNIRKADEQGVATVETLAKILKMHVEAVFRCGQLAPSSVIATRISGLFRIFMDVIPSYVCTSLIMATEDFNEKMEPDFSCLKNVAQAQEILQLIQLHFQTCIVTHLIGTPSIHREVVVWKNELMSRAEEEICGLLAGPVVEGCLNHLTNILAKQKKLDYKPKEDGNTILSFACTATCISACEFIEKMGRAVGAFLDGDNFGLFMIEVGASFHKYVYHYLTPSSLLIEHYKKLTISASGGIFLTKDLAKYQEVFGAFKLAELNDRFEMLREIGNLFIVKPENLKLVINEGYLSRIELKLILEFLQMRADWAKLKNFERELFAVVQEGAFHGSDGITVVV